MTEVRAVHRFFPVGQGLFACGSVEFWPPPPKNRRSIKLPGLTKAAPVGRYWWVYDCGSTTAKRLVANAIEELKADCGTDKIDLLTLSHFHTDHINGVVDLLKEIGAKTVMIPWAPLWHRLLIGFEQGLRADDAEMLFFVDPVDYFSREAGDGFDRVLFVMPSDGVGPPFPTDPDTTPGPPEGSEGHEKDGGIGEPADPDDLDLSGRNGTWRVRILSAGRSIPVLGVWEFVPYNDPATRPSDPAGFASKVNSQRRALLSGDKDEREAALNGLRALYEATVSRGSMNDVSLMLYAGAIGHWRGQSLCGCDCVYHPPIGSCDCWTQYETRASVLLTGDGNLSTDQKWKGFEEYLDSRRATRASVFQVPHHGARANWHDGLAVAASPITSVFSFYPNHSYRHPHAEVLRDFWAYRAIQVDQHAGFSVRWYLER